MESDTVVEARGLNDWFGSGEMKKQALFDVNLTLRRGSFTVLMGPSESGKTTVLTLVGCLRAVQDGSVRLLDQELNGAGEAGLVALRRRLGFIFQAHNLHESLTAAQNVMMGCRCMVACRIASLRRRPSMLLVSLVCRTAHPLCRQVCLAGRSRAWRWRGLWWRAPHWFWPTSRLPRWTRTAPQMWWTC